ncbi:glycosyltransferase family 4 protein [Parapedobacter sp. DT-150]|uniref:glycosyltransferase family 4 protein n=1 Tax=Parapedobacter sp. DT-150 TaxID=3396162 RepID=UPI003F1A48DC
MSDKQKLVYIMHEIALGGAEAALLSALPKLNYYFDLRVYVLEGADRTLLNGVDVSIQEKLRIQGVSVYLLPFYLPKLCISIRRFKPDVIISSLWKSAVVATVYKLFDRRPSYFILLHSSNFFHWADRFFSKIGMRTSDAVFVDSDATAALAAGILGRSAGIKVLSYLTTPTPSDQHKRDFTGRKNFFFVGRLNPIKQVPLAVRAIAWLRKNGVDATLRIFGRDDGDQRTVEKAINFYGLEGVISVEGEIGQEKKRHLYATCDYYIQLSAQEGMAMSVAEAMQQGIVCFVTPVGGIAQYAVDGCSAVFAETADEQSWERSLRKLLEVLGDRQQCEAISNEAHQVFKNMPVFADSLVTAINNHQKQLNVD